MSFGRQLWHLLKVDLRRARWWWVAYVTLLLVSASVPFGAPLVDKMPGSIMGVIPFLAWLAGMALVIVTVQGDAPLSATAFWRGKPINGHALSTAKLLSIGAAVTLAALVALAVWRAVGVPAPDVPRLLAQGGSYLVAMLLVAMLFGAWTRSLGSALLWLTGFLVALVVLIPAAVLLGRGIAVGFGILIYAAASFAVLAILGGVYVLRTMYRHPRAQTSRMGITIGAVATGIVTAQGLLVLDSYRSPAGLQTVPNAVVVTADAPATMTETVRFDTMPRLRPAGASIGFEVVSARHDRRYELQQVRLIPTNRLGISGMFVTPFSTPLAINAPALDIDTAWNWVTSEFEGTTQSSDRGLVFGNMAVSADMDTVRSIALEGTLVRYRAELVARLPFDLGVIHRDSQTTVTLQRRADRAVLLTWSAFERQLDYESLARGTSPLARRLAFVVLDSTTHTAHRLSSTSHTQTSEWLVLPGASRQHHTGVLDAQSAVRPLVGRAGTSLLVYRWIEDGRTRVRQSIAVDDWPRRPPGRGSSTVLITEER